MTTLRKSESARANGAKSRGPTTPEGKLASSQNATEHGIFSRTMILGCESQHRFEQVLAELKEQVQPPNSTESGYVEAIAARARCLSGQFKKPVESPHVSH